MIEFNEARALEVFRILDDCYRNKKELYEHIVLPQDAGPLPSDDPVELANFYFFVAHFMRGGVVNDTQFEFFWHLFIDFPDFFYPAKVHENWSPPRILEAIKSVSAKINGNGRSRVGVLGVKIDEHLPHLHYNMGVVGHFWGGS